MRYLPNLVCGISAKLVILQQLCNNCRYEDLALRAEQAMRMADTALDHLAVANNQQGDPDTSSGDPVPDVEFDEEEVLRTCSDFIKV